MPTVEASSTKIICLTLRVNTRMLSIVPSDAGHGIQRLARVRCLPFPVPLAVPPVGLISAARHRDTPVVRNPRSTLREIVRKGRGIGKNDFGGERFEPGSPKGKKRFRRAT